MKFEETIDTIAKFFNDLISAWVPDSVLAVGLAVIHLGADKLQSLAKIGDGPGAGLIVACLLFATGHALLAIYDNSRQPPSPARQVYQELR